MEEGERDVWEEGEKEGRGGMRVDRSDTRRRRRCQRRHSIELSILLGILGAISPSSPPLVLIKGFFLGFFCNSDFELRLLWDSSSSLRDPRCFQESSMNLEHFV